MNRKLIQYGAKVGRRLDPRRLTLTNRLRHVSWLVLSVAIGWIAGRTAKAQEPLTIDRPSRVLLVQPIFVELTEKQASVAASNQGSLVEPVEPRLVQGGLTACHTFDELGTPIPLSLLDPLLAELDVQLQILEPLRWEVARELVNAASGGRDDLASIQLPPNLVRRPDHQLTLILQPTVRGTQSLGSTRDAAARWREQVMNQLSQELQLHDKAFLPGSAASVSSPARNTPLVNSPEPRASQGVVWAEWPSDFSDSAATLQLLRAVEAGMQPPAEKVPLLVAPSAPEPLPTAEWLPAAQKMLSDLQPRLATATITRPRIRFLSPAEAQLSIIDESYDHYFSRLEQRELMALTGRTDVSSDPLERQRQARLDFQANVGQFTEREEAALTELIQSLEREYGATYPLYFDQPWWFIKISNSLCGGFPHTRGPFIFFSERFVEMAVLAVNQDELGKDRDNARQAMFNLLLHEKTHVLQRLYPARFSRLYEKTWGMLPAIVTDHPWLVQHQMLNPDALNLNWVMPATDSSAGTDSNAKGSTAEEQHPRYFWIRTVLREAAESPRMGRDFQMIAVEVRPAESGFEVLVDASTTQPRWQPTEGLMTGNARWNQSLRLDHPHEMAAYTLPEILFAGAATESADPSNDAVPGEAPAAAIDAWAKVWLRRIELPYAD